MTTIASLSVKIGADIAGMQAGLTQANNSVTSFSQNVGKKFDSMKAGLDSFASGMAPVSAILAAGLGYGIKVASDFEGVMAEIEARTGSTADEMASVSAFALKMGQDTAFSGQEAAEGLLQLMASGQGVEQAIATLPAVLDAAAASGLGLGAAATGITSILSMFQLGATDSADVANSLAQAAGASSAEMGELIDAFINGGGAAAAFGMDVTRTSAIFMAFSDGGKKASEAGTLLNSMLTQMSSQTDTVQGAWADLGTSLYDADGEMRDFSVVIEEIKDGLAGMTTEEQNSALQALGGSFGVAGLRILTTSASITDFEAALAGSASASEVADARMNTFAGRMDSLKGSVEALMIQALTPLMDNVLTPMVEKLTPVINGMTEWAAKNPELVSGILAAVVGVALITPLMWGLSTAFTAVTAAASLLFAPLTLLVVALSFADWDLIGEGAGKVADGLGRLIGGDSSGWETIKTGLTDIGVGLTDIPIGILNTLMDGLEGLTGLKLPDYSFDGVMDGLRVLGDGMALIWDNIIRGLDIFLVDSRLKIASWLDGLRTTILSGTGIDIAPNLVVDTLALAEKARDLKLTNRIEDVLRDQIQAGNGISLLVETGTIDIGPGLSVDGGTLLELFTPGSRYYDEVVASAGVGTKQAIRDGLAQAMYIGDAYTVEILTPLAVALGIDVATVKSDVEAYLISVNPEATLMAAISISPAVQNISGFMNTIRDALTAQPIVASVQAMISVSPILNGVASAISAVIGAITGAAPPAGAAVVDGSHAAGLSFVPFDGYTAELHRGEAVLTAEQASSYRGGGGKPAAQNIFNLNSYGQSPQEFAEWIKRLMAEGAY